MSAEMPTYEKHVKAAVGQLRKHSENKKLMLTWDNLYKDSFYVQKSLKIQIFKSDSCGAMVKYIRKICVFK